MYHITDRSLLSVELSTLAVNILHNVHHSDEVEECTLFFYKTVTLCSHASL